MGITIKPCRIWRDRAFVLYKEIVKNPYDAFAKRVACGNALTVAVFALSIRAYFSRSFFSISKLKASFNGI